MAEEFQSGISSGNWWNSSSRNINGLSVSSSSSSPCSTTLTDNIGNYGSSNWSNNNNNTSSCTRLSCDQQSSSVSVSGSNSIINYQSDHPTNTQIPHNQQGGGSSSESHDHQSSVLMDSSNLQMMGFDLSSSPSTDWTQTLLRNSSSSGRVGERNFHSMLEESDDQNHEDSTSSIHEFKQIQNVFSLDDQQSFNPCNRGGGSSSILLHGFYEPIADHQQQVLQQTSNNYSSSMNFGLNPNELSPSWSPKFPQFLKPNLPLTKLQEQQPTISNNQLHFSNNTQFWNPASSTTTMTDISSSLFSSPKSTQFLSSNILLDDDQKPNYCSNLTLKPMVGEVRDSGSMAKKNSGEQTLKRPRIETPSPLPTFKVRKEKLGDRITALQQLCSPFGKTDTASVLYEAIEYIKFLHEQVTILSNPYMKNNGAPIQYQQNLDKSKDGEGLREDLRSRGLCLVPISSTFSVTTDASTDFWTPTFGGTYR